MDYTLEDSWQKRLVTEFEKPYFNKLADFVDGERFLNPEGVFPKENEVFRAFNACRFDDVKVVILGQDPYPTKGHAHGLCFSVDSGVKPLAKSLVNIFKELKSDLGIEIPENGDLSKWASQGVLLLNSILTVREGEAKSHQKQGWEQFTNAVIDKLNAERSGIVYILWGNGAIEKAKSVDEKRNLILSSSHPSPLGAYRSFWGSKPFSKANAYLKSSGNTEIDW